MGPIRRTVALSLYTLRAMADVPVKSLRARVHEVIFEADTPAGHRFDVILLWLIFISVLTVSLESVASIRQEWGGHLRVLEWGLTIIFTVEYALRLWCVKRAAGYALSFFGLVDLIALLPTYISLMVAGTQALVVVRILRLLRVFRLFRLVEFIGEAQTLITALRASARKISIFLGSVLLLVTCLGSAMYVVEGSPSGFDNIPRSIYWAIVTLTTVGYGDIAPVTPMGQFLAAIVMLAGYAIIAVPTGIVTSELIRSSKGPVTTQVCPSCSREGHAADAVFCKYCGKSMKFD